MIAGGNARVALRKVFELQLEKSLFDDVTGEI